MRVFDFSWTENNLRNFYWILSVYFYNLVDADNDMSLSTMHRGAKCYLMKKLCNCFWKNIQPEKHRKMFEISREGHLILMEEIYFFLTGQFCNGFARHFSQRNHITGPKIIIKMKNLNTTLSLWWQWKDYQLLQWWKQSRKGRGKWSEPRGWRWCPAQLFCSSHHPRYSYWRGSCNSSLKHIFNLTNFIQQVDMDTNRQTVSYKLTLQTFVV